MENLEVIKRQRLLSEANTQVQQKIAYENISVDVRPLQDPDVPPQLSLELDTQPYDDFQTQEDYISSCELQNSKNELKKKCKARSQSLTVSFTILQFMERKIRQRGMSQQLSPTYEKILEQKKRQ